MTRTKMKQSLALILGLALVLAVSSCATTKDTGTRQVASAGDGPGDHGGPGDRGGPGGQQMGPNRNPGQGGHGGPGNGFAPVRVNQPIPFHGGPGDHGGPGPRLWQQRGWQHWNHPGYNPPNYVFDWNHINTMTCIGEDSAGIQYPVNEDGWAGQWQAQMPNIEEDALDTCYNQSSDQNSCYLASCSPT